MYGIFTYIYHEFMPNVGKYAIHGASGIVGRPRYDIFDEILDGTSIRNKPVKPPSG